MASLSRKIRYEYLDERRVERRITMGERQAFELAARHINQGTCTPVTMVVIGANESSMSTMHHSAILMECSRRKLITSRRGRLV